MPHPDRQNNANPVRPLMPTLASTRSAKSPITPRLAGTTKSPIVSSAGAFPRSAARGDPVASSPRAPVKEDVSTPVKSFLSSNVTPRSSARKSRLDSASSTPTGTPTSGTPNTVKSTSTLDASRALTPAPMDCGSAAKVVVTGSRRPLSMVGFSTNSNTPSATSSPAYSTGYSTVRSTGDSRTREGSPMFFHANDAKPQELAPAPRSQKKPPTFFYANGAQEASGPKQPERASPPLSAVSARSGAKFFHADGREEGQDRAIPTPSPRLTSPEPIIREMMMNPLMRRSPSPNKDSLHLSYRKGASQIMRPGNHPPRSVVSPALQTVSEQEKKARRRSSGGSARLGHGKSSSIDSIDSNSSRTPRSIPMPSPAIPEHLPAPTPPTQSRPPLHPRTSDTSQSGVGPTPFSNGGPAGAPPLSPPIPASFPQSPTKAGFSSASLEEMAANARRERKVLDLEISNSSLLAINRQLEREVRKQKTELRRYRRLTRAGRLSEFSALTTRSSLTTADAEDGFSGTEADFVLSDLTESEDEFDSTDESSLSPSVKDARLMKDEKRLRLDLEKHRQLLVDSQRMNQSLRRCLGWTEELIVSGKKALEYRVRVSDVQLGGRVLHHADEDEAIEGAVEEETEEVDETGDLMAEIGAFSAWMGKQPGEALAGISSRPGDASGLLAANDAALDESPRLSTETSTL